MVVPKDLYDKLTEEGVDVGVLVVELLERALQELVGGKETGPKEPVSGEEKIGPSEPDYVEVKTGPNEPDSKKKGPVIKHASPVEEEEEEGPRRKSKADRVSVLRNDVNALLDL